MENNANTNPTTDDEVSLIDLLAVLIRYRKMIIFGTAIITFLAGIWLFVMPVVSKNFDKREVSVTYSIRLNPFSRYIQDGFSSLGLDLQVEGNLLKKLDYTPLIAEIYKKYPFASQKLPKNEMELNDLIEKTIKKQKIKVEKPSIPNMYEITLKPLARNRALADQFVSELVKIIGADVKNDVAKNLPALEENTEKLLKDITELTAEINDLGAISRLKNIKYDIESYKKTDDPFYTLQAKTYEKKVGQGRATKTIIAMFGSFFLFVFIAFMMNAVANVKADPKASGLIRDAWEKGK